MKKYLSKFLVLLLCLNFAAFSLAEQSKEQKEKKEKKGKKEQKKTKAKPDTTYSSSEECLKSVGANAYLDDLKKWQLQMSYCPKFPSAAKSSEKKTPKEERKKGITLKFE